MNSLISRLEPLHARMSKPRPGDWLESHKETGQTFAQYIASDPVVPTPARRTIYILPIGTFTPSQRKVVDLTADFIRSYYGLPVTTQPAVPDSAIPADARRVHPNWGDKQILTTYVLDKLLRPRLPKDAFALIAFTASDLWPGEGWNFVFGQASLRNRVGVWSIYRFGDPAQGQAAFTQCLRRTCAVAVHELGHMFSMHHCTAFECLMCGSNNLAEADRRPIEVCPQCLAKICWATGVEPVDRFRRLLAFCQLHGLDDDRRIYIESLGALGASTQPDA